MGQTYSNIADFPKCGTSSMWYWLSAHLDAWGSEDDLIELTRLREAFQECNRELAANFDVDLSYWEQSS